MVVGLCVLLVVVLALELPKLLKSRELVARHRGARRATAGRRRHRRPTSREAPRRSRRRSSSRRGMYSPCRRSAARPRSAASRRRPASTTRSRLRRPREATVAPVTPTTPVKAPQLPGKIVLGTPGPGKVAVAGWIVILASIPTAAGQSSATSFAKQAAQGGARRDLGSELVEPPPAPRRLLGRLHRPVHEPHASELRCRQRP